MCLQAFCTISFTFDSRKACRIRRAKPISLPNGFEKQHLYFINSSGAYVKTTIGAVAVRL